MLMSQDARADEELSTQQRARILGMDYADTSQMVNKPLYREIIPVEELKSTRIVPLQADQSNILFGVTTSTSQTTMNSLRARFTDQRVSFAIISETGFRDYMLLYDPPKQVVYQDISIENAGAEQTV